MSGRLEGKVCIITGTGGSMGSAAARLFCAQGARVVGCDINVERANATVREVTDAGGEMVSLAPCDLTDYEQCLRLAGLAMETHGRIDALVNFAAMAYFGPVDGIAIEEFNATVDQELNLVFLMCRAAWPHLTRQGGSIVSIASANGKIAQRVLPGIAHGAAKAAVIAMTRQLAVEGGPHDVRANTISPGFTASYQTQPFIEDKQALAMLMETHMIARPGRPEDIAAAALFLVSDESSWITGTDFAIDGGLTAWR